MPIIDDFDIAVEMAGKILLKKGRISLSEIRHVPFVETKQEAVAVAQNLIHKYDVEVVEDKWNGEVTIHLYNLAAKLKQADERRRRSLLRRRTTFAG